MSRYKGGGKRDQNGFTLLEFLIAVLILSVGLLGMASLTGSMINYNRVAFNSTKAVTLAQEKMEELKNLNYESLSSLSSDSDSESIFTRAWTVSADTPDDDMATMTVTVTWAWEGNSKNVNLKSIVAK